MDASMWAAFVALGLCIPLIGVAMAIRFMLLMDRFGGTGDKDDKPPRRRTPPLGGNPYHLP